MQFFFSALYLIILGICFLGLPYYFFTKKKRKVLGGILLAVNIYWIINFYLSYLLNPVENEHGSVTLGMFILLPILPLVSDFVLIIISYTVTSFKKINRKSKS